MKERKIMNLYWIFTLYFITLAERSFAKTLMQRQCQMELLLSSNVSTVLTTAPSIERQRPMDQFRPNQIRPLGARLSRRKRFMAMVPQQSESTTTVPELVRDRSTCPWTMVQDFNETRFPRRMERAVCIHNNGDNRCDISFLEADRTNPSVRNVLDLLEIKTECALVYAKINIVLECCDRGNYFRRWETIDWPVACTCARKRIRSVTPANSLG